MPFAKILENAKEQFNKDIKYFNKHGVKSVFLRRVQELCGLSDEEFIESVSHVRV